MLRVIGLISGPSLDGVARPGLETAGERIVELGPCLTLRYDDRLRSDLRRLLDHAPTLAADDRKVVEADGWDGDAQEPQLFGFLAGRVTFGLPLCFRGTTGVSRPLPGGRIAAA